VSALDALCGNLLQAARHCHSFLLVIYTWSETNTADSFQIRSVPVSGSRHEAPESRNQRFV